MSAHVLTTGFAMPIFAGIVGEVLCAVLGLEGVVAVLFSLTVLAIGYIGGTYYSLSYVKERATTHDWPGCTVPAVVFFAVCMVLWLVGEVIRISIRIPISLLDILGIILFYGFILTAFAKITAKGFRALQEQVEQSGPDETRRCKTTGQTREAHAREQRTRDPNSDSGYTSNEPSRNRPSLDHYFRVLGVQPGAAINEIKAAYKRRMQEYHPDKVASLGKELRDLADAKSKEINAAYRAIMDALGA